MISDLTKQVFDYSPMGVLKVDLYTPSTGSSFTSISNQLVSMGVAIRGKRKWEDPDIPPPVTLATGDVIDVKVVVAENPWDFYIHIVSSNSIFTNSTTMIQSVFFLIEQ